MTASIYGSGTETIQGLLQQIYDVEVAEQGSSQASNGQVEVNTSSTIIRNSSNDRKAITIKNIGSTTVYITIGANATTADGFPVPTDGALEIEGYFGEITGITESGSTLVRFIEIR